MRLPDATATHDAGMRLARGIAEPLLVTLAGELGSGKTSLVRGVLHGLGWTGAVKSPTYTLVEHYVLSSLYFYHFDLYRLDDPDEWQAAGFADEFARPAVWFVEWPDRAGDHLPPADLAIHLAYVGTASEQGRDLALRAFTPAGQKCLSAVTGR